MSDAVRMNLSTFLGCTDSYASLATGVTSSTPAAENKRTAHCDCEEAKKRAAPGTVVDGMAPTEVRNGFCVHCEHAAFYKVPDYRKPVSKTRKKKKIVGKPVNGDGPTLYFDSTYAALQAGFGNIRWALARGNVMKGYVWTYA